MKHFNTLSVAAALMPGSATVGQADGHALALEPGMPTYMALSPKFPGILVVDQPFTAYTAENVAAAVP